MKFRDHKQGQIWLIPPDIEDLIPKDDISRIINDVIEEIDVSFLEKDYKEVGNIAYHPKLMLKILIYSYYNQIYSSRRIEKELERNIYYWYLAGKERPNFRTICRFIKRHQRQIKDVFTKVVQVCLRLKMIDLETIAIDGSKIKANASKERMYGKEKLIKEQQEIELVIKEIVNRSKRLSEKEVSEENKIKKNIPELKQVENRLKFIKKALEEIEETGEETINLTDQDSKIMKEKGRFILGYNSQIIADEKQQIIISAGVIQSPTDKNALEERTEEAIAIIGQKPKNLLADTGYCTVNNLKYLENLNINGILADKPAKQVKQEIDRLWDGKRDGVYSKDLFKYNAEKDVYLCPEGCELKASRTYPLQLKGGEIIFKKSYYNALACYHCQHRKLCTKSKNKFRSLTVREDELILLKAKTKIRSEAGYMLYKKRMKIVEPIFGNIKFNKKFTQFTVRGLKQVNAQFLLVCLVHNIEKIKTFLENNPLRSAFTHKLFLFFCKLNQLSFNFAI